MPGVVSRFPVAIQSYSQKTLPQRVQTVAPPAANYVQRPISKLTSNTPSSHSIIPTTAPPTYRAVTSFKADCTAGNDITAPGNRSGGVAGSRASTLNRFAEVASSSERPLTATMPTRHVVAVRLLERTNNGGDLTRRWRELPPRHHASRHIYIINECIQMMFALCGVVVVSVQQYCWMLDGNLIGFLFHCRISVLPENARIYLFAFT